MFSGVSERSVAISSTSVPIPASSQACAVTKPAFPEAHMAETFVAGPWNPNSCMRMDIGVDGIRVR